jgi:nitroreductase family protein
MNFTTLAKERYSCRKISSRPIESEKLEAIKQAAIAAPTAHNFQPLKVWLIQ